MGWKIFLSFIFILFAIILLVFYWFIPLSTNRFQFKTDGNSNFSIGNSGSMQFYQNMRYPEKQISYKIYECNLKKKNDMEQAFEIISEDSILNFYPVELDERISITCDNQVKMEEGLFVAGEGGPTNITQTSLFNVILNGKILLIKDSSCPKPNVAIHELLHALGFDHSENKNNIMYPISNCDQTIGQDTIDLINELYEIPSYPDLSFKNVSAVINGRYLDSQIIVNNDGLAISQETKILIYADEKLINVLELKPLDIGMGFRITLENVWVSKRNPKELKFFVNSSFNEIDKNNNEVVLEVVG